MSQETKTLAEATPEEIQQYAQDMSGITVDPALLEEKMIEKEKIDSVPAQIGNPEDLAAAFFRQNYPRVKALLGKLSKRGIERAVMCAAAYPLVPEGYKWRSEEERQLAWSLEQMIACKALMIESVKLQKMTSTEDLEKQNELSLDKGADTNE
jgi:hypothetical protein